MRGYLNGKPLEFEGSCDTTIASALPSGAIVMWANREIPDGWAICNGENGTPDLRDRFILSSGSAHALGATGGEEEVALTVANLPSHRHTFNLRNATAGTNTAPSSSMPSGSLLSSKGNTETTGSNTPHNNMPPYYVLYFIMKL